MIPQDKGLKECEREMQVLKGCIMQYKKRRGCKMKINRRVVRAWQWSEWNWKKINRSDWETETAKPKQQKWR